MSRYAVGEKRMVSYHLAPSPWQWKSKYVALVLDAAISAGKFSCSVACKREGRVCKMKRKNRKKKDTKERVPLLGRKTVHCKYVKARHAC